MQRTGIIIPNNTSISPIRSPINRLCPQKLHLSTCQPTSLHLTFYERTTHRDESLQRRIPRPELERRELIYGRIHRDKALAHRARITFTTIKVSPNDQRGQGEGRGAYAMMIGKGI